ncbi:hypothetical protein, partial [Aeromonas rivipollensis]|uniref:hypothetical protein n=1 Tax=Aeromonas rivipollensis TaxID=948519 RepID=UPI003D230B9D
MINFTTISNVSNNETFGVVTWLDLQQAARIPHRSRARASETAKKSAPLVAAHNGKTRNKEQAEAHVQDLKRRVHLKRLPRSCSVSTFSA